MPSRRSVLVRLLRPTLAASVAAALLTTVAALMAAPASAAAGLVGAASGRCLDVTGNSNSNGALLQIWDCNGQANQAFEFTSAGELRVFNGARCVDAYNGQTSPGTKVEIWDCNGGANQKWRQNADGSITGVQSGLCLDVNGAGTANGTPVILWNCTGQLNQRWTTGGTSPTPSPSGGTCNVAPVDPQATAQARKLLCYLYSQYGNHIISGQQESTWVGGPDYEMNYIRNNTGKYPAIRGMDRGDSPDFGSRALSWWNSGGIPMVGYHMGSPAQGSDGYSGSQMNANINAALTPGTADYNRFIQRLDGAATELAKVQAGGGAVIWRPFHEAGGTWFWWSKEGGGQYVRLWRFTFDYLTRTKGLHNLVWLLPYNGQPQSSFYPGKAYVDIAGADTYAGDHGPVTSLFNSTRNIVGSSIPIALHENGPIPDPDQLQSTATRWVLFNTWHTDWITNAGTNPISLLQKVYNSSYVVTRDEVPNLR
ncbi:glycosyl hydrolase [Sphaerisporangium sp. NPDC004334]